MYPSNPWKTFWSIEIFFDSVSVLMSGRFTPDWLVLLVEFVPSTLPTIEMLGKNLLFEILMFCSVALSFCLSAFNLGLFLNAESKKNIRSEAA